MQKPARAMEKRGYQFRGNQTSADGYEIIGFDKRIEQGKKGFEEVYVICLRNYRSMKTHFFKKAIPLKEIKTVPVAA